MLLAYTSLSAVRVYISCATGDVNLCAPRVRKREINYVDQKLTETCFLRNAYNSTSLQAAYRSVNIICTAYINRYYNDS